MYDVCSLCTERIVSDQTVSHSAVEQMDVAFLSYLGIGGLAASKSECLGLT